MRNEIDAAILIDADTFPARLFRRLVNAVGESTVIRAHGGTGYAEMAEWRAVASSGKAVIATACRGMGKRPWRLALVMDAARLFFRNGVRTFFIASNSDVFAPLCARLCRWGARVVGFNGNGATKAFKDACDDFFVIGGKEDLLPADKDGRVLFDAVLKIIDGAIAKNREKIGGGTPSLQDIGEMLRKRYPDFSPSAYGHRSFMKLVTAHFERYAVRQDGNNWTIERVC